MIDDKQYWIKRHKSKKGFMSAVGQRNHSNKANYYVYKMLTDRYRKLLGKLDMAKNAKVLDAGSGIGIFSKFMESQGFQVVAADISQEALDAIGDTKIKTICTSIDKIDFPKGHFDISQCFDVLYHILSDREWEDSIANLCDLSGKYVILHERFLKRRQLINSKHVKPRTYQETLGILKKHGFAEYMSTPTAFFSSRLVTYKFAKHFPWVFYQMDRLTLSLFDKLKINSLGSHHIKVFRKIV
jgi:SAM-dependent methyltransferase